MGPDVENKQYKITIPMIETKNSVIKNILQLQEIDKHKWRDIGEINNNNIDYETILQKWKSLIQNNYSKYMVYRIIERIEKIIFEQK